MGLIDDPYLSQSSRHFYNFLLLHHHHHFRIIITSLRIREGGLIFRYALSTTMRRRQFIRMRNEERIEMRAKMSSNISFLDYNTLNQNNQIFASNFSLSLSFHPISLSSWLDHKSVQVCLGSEEWNELSNTTIIIISNHSLTFRANCND